MNFIANIFAFNEVATVTILISLASVIGILLGSIKFKGVGLGIGGVLFGGIFIGWCAQHFGWVPSSVQDKLDIVSLGMEQNQFTAEVQKYTRKYAEFAAFKQVLHYVQEFGLILFVYTIGIQVGPGFFSSLKGPGVKLIGYAVLIVLLGATIALSYNLFFGLRLDVAIGVYSGAVTNTPALGAGSAMIGEFAQTFIKEGMSSDQIRELLENKGLVKDTVSSAYALAYPFGICGILITMLLIRLIFRVSIDAEGERYEIQKKSNRKDLNTINVSVNNKDMFNKKISSIPLLQGGDVVCSRLKRQNALMVPKGDTIIVQGDILHLVGSEPKLSQAAAYIGETVTESLTTKGTQLVVKKVVVTNEKILGKSIDLLGIRTNFDVAVSRLIRTGMEFIPHSGTTLQFGDQLNLIGTKESIEKVANIVGDSSVAMQKVHMLPVFIGLVLGMLLGCVAIPVPGLPAALKLGLAGGPLVVAILLSRYGHVLTFNKIHWFMPTAGNSALREIGIVLFLVIVGFNAGLNGFVDNLVHGDGLSWMGWGVFVTIVPLLISGFLAFKLSKLNYLSVCGMLAGSMTDPPALAYANGMYKNSEASSLGYATVYPFTMFLRILTPQLMILIALSLA
ncbi:MAG: putative transporter [Succinivibrionaceae bacterium]